MEESTTFIICFVVWTLISFTIGVGFISADLNGKAKEICIASALHKEDIENGWFDKKEMRVMCKESETYILINH